jgi:hypothetical protein
MSNTVYLIVLESTMATKVIENGIVDLFNARNAKHGLSLGYGQTYGGMRTLLENNKPIKGAGYIRLKDGTKYWVLPFVEHELMGDFNDVVVLTKAELRDYGWDVPEEVA